MYFAKCSFVASTSDILMFVFSLQASILQSSVRVRRPAPGRRAVGARALLPQVRFPIVPGGAAGPAYHFLFAQRRFPLRERRL